MIKEYNRKLVLEDGSVYPGYAFGAEEERICELVFNTSVVGYQEIISDPSYTDQAVVMSYPLIGNYGMAEDDYETEIPTIGALIVRDYNDQPSNFRSVKTLSEVMKEYHIPGLYGIDTRKLVRQIRNHGSGLGIITDMTVDVDEAVERIHAYQIPHDAVSRVSRKEICFYPAVIPEANEPGEQELASREKPYHVVAVDCGMKQNIVRSMNKKGCDVTVVPYNTDAETIRSLNPDGVFLSNGPGDPTDVTPVINLIKEIRGEMPIFGICLGHQMISLAYGARTYKLKFGHRGGNHPVLNLASGKIEITSQNHSYAVDEESLQYTDLEVTHRNILDQTIEGVECVKDQVFSVQYHPESAPGPQDSAYLFDRFLRFMYRNREIEKMIAWKI